MIYDKNKSYPYKAYLYKLVLVWYDIVYNFYIFLPPISHHTNFSYI